MQKPTQLSEHFTLEEATFSSTAARLGIDNSSPSPQVKTAASFVAVKMEKVRVILDSPIHIDSWIRCLELNRALKSKDTSQHILGEAVDFTCSGFGSPVQICRELIANQSVLRYDQLILEHTWVHISFKSVPGAVQRGQVLSLLGTGGYANGLTNSEGKLYV